MHLDFVLFASSVMMRRLVFCVAWTVLNRVSYRIFGLGGEIYWCINEARKCERRGLGASPSLH